MKIRCFIFTLISLTIFTPASLGHENFIFRRLRTHHSSSEFILNAGLSVPLSEDLVVSIAKQIPELITMVEKRVQLNFWSESTWKVGLTIAILKDIEGLKLENIDIALWINEHYSNIKKDFPYLETPNFSAPFETVRDDFKAAKKTLYDDMQSLINAYYFLDFIQRARSSPANYTVFDKSTRERFILGKILNLHIYRDRHPKSAQLIPHSYIPDLYTLLELKFEHPSIYESEMNGYLLGHLLEFELEGYADRYLRVKKYFREIQMIKYEVFYEYPIDQVKRELRMYYSMSDEKFSSVASKLINTASEGFLRNLLCENKISELLEEDVKRFVQVNYPVVRRIVWSAFHLKPEFGKGNYLIDLLGFSEAEYLARRVMRLYFGELIKDTSIRVGEDVDNFDPHFSKNKLTNRTAYEDWSNVKKEIASIEERFVDLADPYRKHRAIVYYLLKKLATAGAYDLSNKELRERFDEEGMLSGIEELNDMRRHRFELSSFNKLFDEVLANKEKRIKLVISADNHGEIVYLLGLIQYVLEEVNPNIVVYLIPKSHPVANDVYYSAIWEMLYYDQDVTGREQESKGMLYFDLLYNQLLSPLRDKRFILVSDGPDLQGDDARVVSQEEFYALTSPKLWKFGFDKIVDFRIGCAHWRTSQELFSPALVSSLEEQNVKVERYFMHRIKFPNVAKSIGISEEEAPLILAYVEPSIPIGTTFASYDTLMDYVKAHPKFYDPPLGSYK